MRGRFPKILFGACGVVSSAVLVYVLWRLEEYSAAGRVLYPLTALVAAAGGFAALFLPPRWRSRLAVVVTLVVLSAYGTELYLFHHRPMAVNARLKGAPADGVDPRTPAMVVADLRQRGIDAHPYFTTFHLASAGPDGELVSPLSGVGGELWPLGALSGKTLVVCREGQKYLSYESDERGFHNPYGLWSQVPTQVAVLGDQYAQGGCVPDNKDIIAYIRARFPRTLSLGSAGASAFTELGAMKEYLPAQRPKWVLWFFFEGNDMEGLRAERQSPLLRRYLEEGFRQRLAERQPEIDRLYLERSAERLVSIRRHEIFEARQRIIASLKLSNLRLLLGLARPRHLLPPDEDFRLFGKILADARRTVAQWDGRLVLVYMPSPWRYHPYLRHGTEPAVHDRIVAIARDLALTVIDLDPVLTAASDDPESLFQGHLTEEGSRIVGQFIANYLSKPPALSAGSGSGGG